ncbi:uncharacterized protein LOC130415649 isoform X2 [Triplophysa dalaica]|uniref:uncharacterized protein LOC130415649 isoform X2 n=1 Tax=Triplophysa dalaica TaxID=1582913 RepID=UPI0024DF6AAE|nr:uncharacterized protein LOC130415649 isoform X2 [Triplophysa dalaica]
MKTSDALSQEMMEEKQSAAEKCNEEVFIDLKKKDTALKNVKQKTSDNVIKVNDQETRNRDQEIRHRDQGIILLKNRNIEQQQKISNTENNPRVLKDKNQKDLSGPQKSSSDGSFKFWFLVVGVLFVFACCCALVYKDKQHTTERLEATKTEITELKKRNNELDLDIRRREAERFKATKTEITELKKRNNELVLEMQRREAENSELKKRNNELDLHLQRCKDESYERLEPSAVPSMYWILIVGLVLIVVYTRANKKTQNSDLRQQIQDSLNGGETISWTQYYRVVKLKSLK